MTLESAIELDTKGDVISAAKAYEEVIEISPQCEQAVANLVVLYWRSTEYGFWTARGLPRDYVQLASARLPTMLAAATGPDSQPNVYFWKRYIEWADLGEPLTIDECLDLLGSHPDCLDPAMYVYSTSRKHQCVSEARALRDIYRNLGTCRAQYVVSVIGEVA